MLVSHLVCIVVHKLVCISGLGLRAGSSSSSLTSGGRAVSSSGSGRAGRVVPVEAGPLVVGNAVHPEGVGHPWILLGRRQPLRGCLFLLVDLKVEAL